MEAITKVVVAELFLEVFKKTISAFLSEKIGR